MQIPTTLQGRPFGPEQLAQVRALLGQRSDWSRYGLSRELARLWDWRTPQGQLKDMAARTLLLKLQAQGWIALPPARMKSPTRSGRAPALGGAALKESPVACALHEVLPLRLCEVSLAQHREIRRQLEAALHRYHYLGYRSRVGQNLQYWVCDKQDRPLACVVFGAAAWQCAVRDQWIGWSARQRARQLGLIVNNTRFLIFPWVRVQQLASHLLSQISRRVRRDWQAKVRAADLAAGNLRGPAPLCRHLLPRRQLALPGANPGPGTPGSLGAALHHDQGCLCLPVALPLSPLSEPAGNHPPCLTPSHACLSAATPRSVTHARTRNPGQ